MSPVKHSADSTDLAAMHATWLPASCKQPANHPICSISRPNLRHHRNLVVCACKAAVGIDLGTTNSVVAVLREGEARPTVIHDSSSGSFTVPSVVCYDTATDKPLVGAAARQQAATNPSNTFYSVKRLMGRTWEEAQGLGLIYGLQKTQCGGVELVCPAKSSTLAPQQVRQQPAGWPHMVHTWCVWPTNKLAFPLQSAFWSQLQAKSTHALPHFADLLMHASHSACIDKVLTSLGTGCFLAICAGVC